MLSLLLLLLLMLLLLMLLFLSLLVTLLLLLSLLLLMWLLLLPLLLILLLLVHCWHPAVLWHQCWRCHLSLWLLILLIYGGRRLSMVVSRCSWVH